MIPALPLLPLVSGPSGAGFIPPPPWLPFPPPTVAPVLPDVAGTVFVIPTDASAPEIAPYAQRVPLNGTTYVLAFAWNSRAAVWTVEIQDSGGNVIVSSIPIRNGLPVAAWAAAIPGWPPGQFVAVPVDNNSADAGQDGLGSRVLFCYLEV